jgi:hypothetical protein
MVDADGAGANGADKDRPASGGELLDLECGPASPLPETYQRYRLVAHLGSGGQADVYRAVRLCGGVASAPVTVKVFRIDPNRPLADELRSWDKGDAALMDLNNRGVPAICRRADGFYGPPPHRPGALPEPGNAVPYQIYDYLHGVNLRQYVESAQGARGTRGAQPGRRLVAVGALNTLANVLRALHHPDEPDACPVLHMDVKPSNVLVLATGEVRLIDFTGARYWRAEEITQIAYTPESGGPEALAGHVGAAYDVHGFGAVAYFMVTGALPRGRNVPVAGDHPVLAGHPALRDHLLATLADEPGDRPATLELPTWVEKLASLMRSAGVPEAGVDWADPAGAPVPGRVVGRASVVSGTETDAFRRIERLERELVRLRAEVAPDQAGAGDGPGRLLATSVYAGRVLPAGNGGAPVAGARAPGALAAGALVAGAAVVGAPVGPPGCGTRVERNTPPGAGAPPAGGWPLGRAAVVPRPALAADFTAAGSANAGATAADSAGQLRGRPPSGETARVLRLGGGWSWFGAIFAFTCAIIWAIGNRPANMLVPVLAFVLVLLVGVGLFALLRVLGRYFIERLLQRRRRTARLSHLGVAAYLVAVGIGYLAETPWVVDLWNWLAG